MKKIYITPSITNSDEERGAFPLAGAVGALAGYAATRAVTNSMKVLAIKARKGLNLKESKYDVI